MVGGPGARKLDLLRGSIVQAHANGLWPHLTDVTRWPEWLRDARGREGLLRVEPLGTPSGTIDPLQPELGKRFRFTFSKGFVGDFQITYWLEPAQISLGLVRETRKDSHGIEGMIFDLDLFPQPDGATKLWFGALVMLEKDFRPSFLSPWPKRTILGWVEQFHARVGKQGPQMAQGIRTRKEMERVFGVPAAPKP